QAANRSVISASKVAAVRSFDLNHTRAEIGELSRRERYGDRLLQSDDKNSAEWRRHAAHHSTGPQCRTEPRRKAFLRGVNFAGRFKILSTTNHPQQIECYRMSRSARDPGGGTGRT